MPDERGTGLAKKTDEVWYDRYLALRSEARRREQRRDPFSSLTASSSAAGEYQRLRLRLRELEKLVAEAGMPVYPVRGTGINGMQALVNKYELLLARRVDERRKGVLASSLSGPTAGDILRQQVEANRRLMKELGKELLGTFAEDEPAEAWKGSGLRPQARIVVSQPVAFRNGEATYVLQTKEAYEMEDIDGATVYVAKEAVERVVRAGKVRGYQSFRSEEMQELDAVLRASEHVRRAELRAAIVAGNHDPKRVLAVASAEKEQARYRVRLGLPKHYTTLECCGELAKPIQREEDNREEAYA